MTASLPLLAGLVVMVLIAALEASGDRVPRRQLAPEEVRAIHRDKLWWTVRRSKREATRTAIAIGSEKGS